MEHESWTSNVIQDRDLAIFALTICLRRFPQCRRIVDDKSYNVIILVLRLRQ